MEKVSWTGSVKRNNYYTQSEERNILHTVFRRKAK
jgi:hypothetical protein